LLAHEKRRALAEARVRLIESEVAAKSSSAQGALYTYEAELPDVHTSQIEIALQVLRRDRYGNPYYAPNTRKITQAPVRAEVFNCARGAWQPLVLRDTDPLQASAPTAPAPLSPGQRNEWKLAATLCGGYSFYNLPLLDSKLIDGYIQMSDKEAILTARRLAKEEGLFGGFSSGANVAAALQLLQTSHRGKTIAVLIPDSGLKYLSTDLWG
jgi:hypothetical protein